MVVVVGGGAIKSLKARGRKVRGRVTGRKDERKRERKRKK